MKMSRTKGWGIRRTAVAISVSIFGFSGLGHSTASAALLPLTTAPAPNSSYNFQSTPATAPYPFGGFTASDSSPIVYTDPNTLVQTTLGTLLSYVYPDGTGGEEFVYQVQVAATVGDSFDSVTVSRFPSVVSTAVGYNNPGTTVDPTNVQRTINNNVDWGFLVSPGNGSLGAGQTSDFLLVDTNSTGYMMGNGAIIDEITGDGTLEVPTNAIFVPEPASIGVIVLASGMLLGRRRRA